MRTRSSASSLSNTSAVLPKRYPPLKRRCHRRRRRSLSSSSDENTQNTMMETMQMTDAAMESLMRCPIKPSAPIIKSALSTKPAMASLPQQQSTLLSLPVEILMLIAEYTLPATDDPTDPALSVPISIYCACSGTDHLHRADSYCYSQNLPKRRSTAVSPCAALLRTCRALYSVTRTVLYNHTVFHFTEKARTFPELPPTACPAYDTLARHGTHTVRAIKLSIDLYVLLDPSAWLHKRLLMLRSLFPNLHTLAIEVLPPPMAHRHVVWTGGHAHVAPAASALGAKDPKGRVFDVLADPLLRRCCTLLVISTCFSRFEHLWTFTTTVGGHSARPSMKPRRQDTTVADLSPSSSYIDFCEKTGRVERQRMREQLAFLPRWIKLLADQEHELVQKRNVAATFQADLLKRNMAVDSGDMAKAMQLLEPIHTVRERRDWWWW